MTNSSNNWELSSPVSFEVTPNISTCMNKNIVNILKRLFSLRNVHSTTFTLILTSLVLILTWTENHNTTFVFFFHIFLFSMLSLLFSDYLVKMVNSVEPPGLSACIRFSSIACATTDCPRTKMF